MEATKVATTEAILPTVILGVIPLLKIHRGAATLTTLEIIILEVVISIELYLESSLH